MCSALSTQHSALEPSDVLRREHLKLVQIAQQEAGVCQPAGWHPRRRTESSHVITQERQCLQGWRDGWREGEVLGLDQDEVTDKGRGED